MKEERETTSKSDSNRLGNCEVCGGEKAQYTCPRCELKTCSLECVKIHKRELDCSGDRDKCGYVPISKFTNLNLLSDYRLLEDVSRAVDNCKRNPFKKSTRFNRPLPPHLFRLRKEGLARKTNILFLPRHFTRHKENTTFLHFETKTIYWKLELVFYQANELKVVMQDCDENERLSTVLSNFIDFDKCPETYRKSLKFYHSAGLPGLEILLKAENMKGRDLFFALDLSSTLKENFENRIIIEHPVLYVIFKSHKDEFTILDPDMEVEFKPEKSGRRNQFSNFVPFTYFDTVTYTKKSDKGDEAMRSINSSAAELRKYFSCDKSDEEIEEEEESTPVKSTGLNIPPYEILISDNS